MSSVRTTMKNNKTNQSAQRTLNTCESYLIILIIFVLFFINNLNDSFTYGCSIERVSNLDFECNSFLSLQAIIHTHDLSCRALRIRCNLRVRYGLHSKLQMFQHSYLENNICQRETIFVVELRKDRRCCAVLSG